MIKATKYTREDGCSIHYNEHVDGWILTCYPGGPNYVWNEKNSKWLVVSSEEYVLSAPRDLHMAFPIAMERLQTIHHARVDLARASKNIIL